MILDRKMVFLRIQHYFHLLLGFRIILLASLLFGFTGCAGKDVNENDPAYLYSEAEEDIKSGRYEIAIEQLRLVKNKFPYSKYSPLAYLRMADIYFLRESFEEASITYEAFSDLYPNHDRAAYALYCIGHSYFMSIPNIVARDLSSAHKTIAAHRHFIEQHPSNEYVSMAAKDIQQAQEFLAQKEVLIGDFYSREQHWSAANNRYQKTVKLYPNTRASEVAEKKIAQIKPNLVAKGQKENADTL